MSRQEFNEIIKRVQNLHTDFENGISDEQAYDMALFILDDNPGLKEYINKNMGATDAIGWLMHEI